MGEMFLSNSPLKKIIFLLYCKILINAKIIICQNIEDQKYFVKKNNKLKKKIKVVFGSGINTKKYNFSKIKNSKKFNFLIVSRIIKEKGILEFINAAIKFEYNYPNSANFLIIGRTYNGNFKRIFFKKINQSKIIYKESSSNIKKDIIKSSCCVLPSYREGLSRFLLEAISIGRPIITSNVPGCNILVKNDINGYLLPKINTELLYKSFIKISSLSKKKINTLSINSRKLSYKFDSEIIDNQLIKILKTL
jgi:galacturonosyltransferase